LKRRRARRRGRGKRRFGGLILLALGTWVVARVRGRRRSQPVAPGSRPGARPAKADAGTGSAVAAQAETRISVLVPEGQEAWVPGPAGSIHLVSCHAGGRAEVAFVHGLGGRLAHWHQQLAALGPALAGMAFDLPGHGGSDPARGEHDAVDSAAAALGAALDAAGIRRPLVVAHGWGSLAALRWAAARPGRARGLLLIDPPGDQSRMARDEVAAFRQAVAEDARGTLGQFVEHSLADVSSPIAARVLADLEATEDNMLRAALKASTLATPAADAITASVPIHLATSDLGRGPKTLDRLLPAAVCWRLERGGHWPMLVRPERFNHLLDDVLDALPGISQA